MAEAFIVRRGGGGSGGTLVVTSAGAGTVTVSNNILGKSYSKSVTAGGSVTFKGLKTGEWTVTVSNGTQTATRSVTINADYSVSVAYFSATISITYPANSNCVVTNSGGQTVASDSNTDSSAKTWTATVGATGTYTVTATSTIDGSKTKSATVSIATEGQSESVTLKYELVLYDAGDQYTAVTGGWSSSHAGYDSAASGGSTSFNTSSMTLDVGYHKDACLSTANTINTSGYSTINFTISQFSDPNYYGDSYVGLTTNRSAVPSYVAKKSAATGTISVSISNAQGSYYAAVSGTGSQKFTITKVWLA